jgi:hypothetical protein
MISDSAASAATTAICSCQSEWQTKEEQIKALQGEVVEAWKRPILCGVAYFDAELAEMDGQPVEGLSTTTTIGNAGLGQKGWVHLPLEGEWIHLVNEVTHA